MKMQLLKTATKRLRSTKLPLRVYRRPYEGRWGYVIVDLRHRRSISEIFTSADEAVSAALNGYLPTPSTDVVGETNEHTSQNEVG